MKYIKDLIKAMLNRFFKKYIVYSLPNNNNEIIITFDDGPCAGATELILDTLKIYNTKACFFVLGKHAEKHPEIIKRMHDEGHEIGIHGYNHARAGTVSTKEYVDGVTKANNIIETIIEAKTTKIFRPPYGDITLPTFLSLLYCGYKYVMWDYDSEDSFISATDDLLLHIKSKPPLGGSICLFHDDYERTSEILGKLIEHWKSIGFKFKTISNL